jgi:hypothetical protein
LGRESTCERREFTEGQGEEQKNARKGPLRRRGKELKVKNTNCVEGQGTRENGEETKGKEYSIKVTNRARKFQRKM